MLRTGLCSLLCAGILLGVLSFLPAAPEDESARKTELLLGVQRALAKGREHLQHGHYKAAVDILERELATGYNPFENRDYLRALSEAYLGYVTELKQANQLGEAAVYQRRLANIDPGALLELKGSFAANSASAPAVAAAPGSKPLLPPPPAPVSLIPLTLAQSTPTVTARGQVKEEPKEEPKVDPFDDANSKAAQTVRELIDKAEREFDAACAAAPEGRAAHYEAAGRLFEQAEKTLKGSVGAARERWAYCKIHGVVNDLNRQSGPLAAAQDLEREVRLAQSMSPKLDGIGRDLLRRIQERQGTTPGTGAPATPPVEEAVIEVKHTPRQGDRWAMAETKHFRILHLQSAEVAEKAARLAESARLASAKKWFGEALPPWETRCDIYLFNTAEDYSRATSQSPQCPGHSTMPMEGARVLERRIDLHCDDPNYSVGVLPHEVTHVTLAGRFPAALPRWADEGMAVLSEPRDRVERHLRNLPNHAQQQQLFPIGQLMQQFDKKYPEPQRIGAFYAQSVSLVDYLSRLRGPPVFAQFVAEGMRGGYEAALRKFYNLKSFDDLDVAWQRHALGEGAAARLGQP